MKTLGQLLKPRIRCYAWSTGWWYVFPDGLICRMDPDWCEVYFTWNEMRRYGNVPFLFY